MATDFAFPIPLLFMKRTQRLPVEKNLAFISVALNSATVTRFPILQTTFASIAKIFEILQNAQINKCEFMELAEELLMLMVAISVKLMDQQEINQSLKDNIEELLRMLQEIEFFVASRAKLELNMITATVLPISDWYTIGVSRLELERRLRSFGFQSLLDFQEETIQLMEQCVKNGDFSITTTRFTNNSTENIILFGDCQTHGTSLRSHDRLQNKTEQLVEPHIKNGSASNTAMNADNTTKNTISPDNSRLGEDGTSPTSHDRLGSALEQFGLNTSGFRRRRMWINDANM